MAQLNKVNEFVQEIAEHLAKHKPPYCQIIIMSGDEIISIKSVPNGWEKGILELNVDEDHVLAHLSWEMTF